MTVEVSYWSWKVNKELKIQELKDHLRGTEITRNYDGSSARELKPLIWKNINGNVKVNRDSVDDCNKNWSKEQGEHLFHPLSPLVQRCGKEKSYSWDGCKKNHYPQELWSLLSSASSIVYLKLNWRLIINWAKKASSSQFWKRKKKLQQIVFEKHSKILSEYPGVLISHNIS